MKPSAVLELIVKLLEEKFGAFIPGFLLAQLTPYLDELVGQYEAHARAVLQAKLDDLLREARLIG